MNNARKITNQLLESIDDGLLTNKTVLESLLKYLSEDQVSEFYQSFLDEGHAEYLPGMSSENYLPGAAKQPELSVTSLSNDAGTGLWDRAAALGST